MTDFQTEHRVESKLAPGVTFVIHPPTYGRRIQFDRAIAEFRAKTRLIERRYAKLKDQQNEMVRKFESTRKRQLADMEAAIAEEPDAETRKALTDELEDLKAAPFLLPETLQTEFDQVESDSLQAMACDFEAPRLRTYLVAVEGLKLGGVPATPELLLEKGPTELTREALDAIDEIANVTAEQLKNLSSPSISSSPEGGKTNGMTATTAAESEPTKTETAPSTSPAT